MLSSNLIRWSGRLAVLGSILWVGTWILVEFTAGGTRALLGFSERGWRTLLLNPAMLFFMAGIVGLHATHAGRSGGLVTGGFVISLLGLGTMLVGNVSEFWVFDLFYGTQGPGWEVMGVGLLLFPIGLLLFGIGTLKARVLSRWRRAVPLGFGLLLALLILSGVARMLLFGSSSQVGLLRAVVVSIAAGWGVVGFVLSSDQTDGASRSHERAG